MCSVSDKKLQEREVSEKTKSIRIEKVKGHSNLDDGDKEIKSDGDHLS